MPGLLLLAPGSWVLWLLLPEQTLPARKELRPLLSQLGPMRKRWRRQPAETITRRKQAHFTFLFCSVTKKIFSLNLLWPWYGWSRHEEPSLSYEPHTAAHPETKHLWYLPICSKPGRGRDKLVFHSFCKSQAITPLVSNSPVHRGVFQASRYPRCIPGHQSFPNPPTLQPQPETNTTLKQSDNQNRQITANASIHTNCSPASQCTVWRPEWAAGEGEHHARLPLHFLLGPTDDTHPSPEERPLETLPVVWEACVLKHDRKHCVEFVHPCQLTSILARVCMCSGWSLRSFPKAVRRVA